MTFFLNSLIGWGFNILLGFYLITNLQWYNYSFYRVFTKHHKILWHVYFAFLPLALFCLSSLSGSQTLFYVFGILCLGLYLPFLCLWNLHLDKRLVFTHRVKIFFVLLLACLILHQWLFSLIPDYPISFLLPLCIAFGLSWLYEKMLFFYYFRMAKRKVNSQPNLKIISITASFGKTSIKNFLYQILRSSFNTYATPRSVNTIKGIISDINENLSSDTEIYITEAGARERGDIKEIANLLNPHYIIIGEIGTQHIEYFKTLDNIIQTKFELLESRRLQKAFIHQDNILPAHTPQEKITIYPANVQNVQATLEGISFDLEVKKVFYHFQSSILGDFNVHNLSAAILMASDLGMSVEQIQKAVRELQPVSHRLQKSVVGEKIILDDSFNGNLKGMKEAIRISSLHQGRKVIITPGLVESDAPSNIELARAINDVFDLVIITGELNSKLLADHIKHPQKIILKNKSQLENILLASTHKGDLLLFANDAPNFI